MKALRFKKQHLWKGLNDFLYAQLLCSELWSLRLLSPGVFLSHVQILSRKNLLKVATAAGRDVLHGLHALAISAVINKRILLGLGVVGVVTPLSACMYMLFDQTVQVQNWYHVNNFYLFMLLGPYLAGTFLTMGVFFLFPRESKRAYILIAPLSYLIGKILWLYLTTSNAQYWSVPHWSFFAIGACISVVLLISLDWLTWRFFHRELAFEKRFELIAANREKFGMDQIGAMFLKTWDERKNFQKQY